MLVSRSSRVFHVSWKARVVMSFSFAFTSASFQKYSWRPCTHSKYDTTTPPALARTSGRMRTPMSSRIASADEILEEKGVLILPDILANAGGVVVSYFEWVQGLQEYFWKEDEVNAKLNEIVTKAFEETWEVHERREISMRLAAYGLAVERVAEATMTRGLYP